MQSSFKIIKSELVLAGGNKEIATNFDNNSSYQNNETEEEIVVSPEDRAFQIIQEAEEKAESIIENALSRSSETILKANSDAVEIEKAAFEKGYEEGHQQGYNEAYQNTVEKGQQEAERIISHANQMLLKAKLEYENYLEDKKEEILHIAIHMAETVLKRELELPHGLNACFEEIFQKSQNMNSCIIRANSVHCEEIKANIDNWKEINALKCEVFIIPDEEIGAYDAVVEKNNGRLEIGLTAGMEGIKKALL